MKQSRFSEEQVVRILAKADQGEKTITELCREQGISQATYYKEYRKLKRENARLKKLPASGVQQVLSRLFAQRGAPEYLRSDQGPEFLAQELREWLSKQGVKTHHIERGSPWQNAYGESFNATLRRECLNRELFHSLLEARVKTQRWRIRYNERRPHSALGYLTPVEFRNGVRIPLLERGRPSTHQDSQRHNGEKNSLLTIGTILGGWPRDFRLLIESTLKQAISSTG